MCGCGYSGGRCVGVGMMEGGVCGYSGGRCVWVWVCWREVCVGVGMLEGGVCVGVGMLEGGVCVGVGMMEVCMGVGIVEGARYVCGLFFTLRLHSKSKVLWYMYVWCLCEVR